MLPFLTQPAVAPACHVPRAGSTIGQSLIMGGGRALLRTPAVAGNGKCGTLHGYVGAAASAVIIEVGPDLYNRTSLFWDAGSLYIYHVVGGDTKFYRATAARYRDYSRLYEVHLVWDLPTVRLFVGGAEVTTWLASPNTNVLTADDTLYLNTAVPHAIGRNVYNTIGYLPALVSDLRMVDGAVLLPDAMGEANIHGVRVPKPLTEIEAAITAAGGYGTAGWHLDFALPLDPGHDVSGRGNHWAASGFDAAGKDTVASSPTTRFAVASALNASTNCAVSNGGLTLTASGGNVYTACAADMMLPADLKVYWEVWTGNATTNTAGRNYGICLAGEGEPLQTRNGGNLSDNAIADAHGAGVSYSDQWSAAALGVVQLSPGAVGATNRVHGLGYNPTAGELHWWLDGAYQGKVTGLDPDTVGRYVPVFGPQGAAEEINFGQRNAVGGGATTYDAASGGKWRYPPPAGWYALSTDNQPEPAIKDPAEAFTQAAATGANMVSVLEAATAHWKGAPWVEITKRSDAVEDWRVRFSDDPANSWATNNANAKGVAPALAAAGSYVGYRLRLGKKYGTWAAEVTHVSGSATTVTHGLATADNVVIATRVSTGGGDRYMWHPAMTAGQLGKMNSNGQLAADGTLTDFNASSFQIASAAPSGIYRVLVLAHRPGWLEIGSYKGNGAADGAFDPMGIAPLWQLVRRLDNTGAWFQADTAHSPTNPMVKHFDLDKSNTEINASYDLDMVVGGVKYRTAGYSSNDAGGNYLRIAIGRPVGGVCVAPATAR